MAYTVIPSYQGPGKPRKFVVWHSESQSPASRLFATEAAAEDERQRMLRFSRFVDTCSYVGDDAHDGDESVL